MNVAAGAVLDVSGGGTLTGGGGERFNSSGALQSQGFISGRGGSTDALVTPLLAFSGGTLTSSPKVVTSSSATQIYAIMPGFGSSYAPISAYDLASIYAGSVPGIGERITIPAGVQGLPAGTYTLLPSYYALLPGAYRVQLATTTHTTLPGTVANTDGSFTLDATLGVANTAISSTLPIVATVSSGSVTRTYSTYDEEDYGSFVVANAARFSTFRGAIPADAGTLTLDFLAPAQPLPAFTFNGTLLANAAAGGFDGTVVVGAGIKDVVSSAVEITAAGATPTAGDVSIPAAALDALDAPTLAVGGIPSPTAGKNGVLGFLGFASDAGVTLGRGAQLAAGPVFLLDASANGITLAPGSSITTVGRVMPSYDSNSGIAYSNQSPTNTSSITYGVLALSNGFLDFLPPQPNAVPITVGANVALATSGTLAINTTGSVTLDPSAVYGARTISLGVQRINIGDTSTVAAADVPVGLTITPALLASLQAGDPALGTPKLQSLSLGASGSINVYGSVDFGSVVGSLSQLVINTPAIYGAGAAGDTATIAAGTLYLNGAYTVGSTFVPSATDVADGVVAGGPGSGAGTLILSANKIVLGYTPDSQPPSGLTLRRQFAGFSTVDLNATQAITANHASTLSVAGALNLNTPLLTGDAASVLTVTATGPLSLAPQAGAALGSSTALGATLTLIGSTITDTSAISLPSGMLTLHAAGAITLGPRSVIDLAGRNVAIFDQTVANPGGTLVMESATGSITQDPSGRITVAASGADAGQISASALAGTVGLQGTIQGGTTGGFAAGQFTMRTGTLAQADFTSLNQRLTDGGVLGARSFEVASGNLAIASSDVVQAQSVTVSTDTGSLTVNGLINASGATPGTIRLSAGGALTLAGTAMLDTHGTVLQVDSYGAPIDAENTGHVELTSNAGTITLHSGASIDVSSPDGVARGEVQLNAPRVGTNSVGVSAPGAVAVKGAATIDVNAFRLYQPTDANGTITQTDEGISGSVNLTRIDADNTKFMTAALKNTGLSTQLAGLLIPYASVFHLRPGVAVDSSNASGGTLTVVGDLDLSAFRYASLNPNTQLNPAVYGSGEPGALVLRASDNLTITGSISDGFGRVAASATSDPNQNGWQLYPGQEQFGQTVVVPLDVPQPIVLRASRAGQQTSFPTGDYTLNYAIPIASASLNANIAVPTAVTLSGDYAVPTGGFTTTAAITLPSGKVIATGTILPAGTQLPAGSVLAQGGMLPFAFSIAATNWPIGASFAVFSSPVTLSANITLIGGDVIPVGANLVFPRVDPSFALRPTDTNGVQGAIAPLAPLLTGEQSWSMRLVAGANPAAADQRAVQPASVLAAKASATDPAPGSIELADTHYLFASDGATVQQPGISVVRNGTGDLDLLAGGNFGEQSFYGVYTAGTQAGGIAAQFTISPSGAINYFPTSGGDLRVSAQGSLVGDVLVAFNPAFTSNQTSNWLNWQGGGATPTAWAINFGQYDSASGVLYAPSGFATFGGGNVTIEADGDAGNIALTPNPIAANNVTTALDVTVASSGRVSDGRVEQTGGGDATITVGGSLNPGAIPENNPYNVNNGTLTDLRGKLSVSAGGIGTIQLSYGSTPGSNSGIDPRAPNPYVAETASTITGGPIVILGDGTASLTARGDLVLGGTGDAIISNGTSNRTSREQQQHLVHPVAADHRNLAARDRRQFEPVTQAQTEAAATTNDAVNDVLYGGRI